MNRIDEYWAWFFGLDLDVYRVLSTNIVAHSHPEFEEYNGAWVFNHAGKWVVSVPCGMVEQAHDRVLSWQGDLMSREAVDYVFGPIVSTVAGPAFQGYAEWGDFRPDTKHPARRLTEADRPALEALLRACDQAEAAHSSISVDDPLIYGCFVDDRLVSAATGMKVGPWTVSPGVLTHPDFRGEGYGRCAVSALIWDVLEAGDLIVYQTLLSNTGALKLAQGLGIQEYATHIAVRFIEELTSDYCGSERGRAAGTRDRRGR